jgi:hypothetical protein
MRHYSLYPNRTICDVLREMREMYKTCNFSMMPSLIEELQVMANRIEAKLDTQNDYFALRDKIKETHKELEKLEKELEEKQCKLKLKNYMKKQ